MATQARTVEEKLALLARAQYGVVTRAQLLEARVTRDEIHARLRNGLLLRQHRGVYRVGHQAPSVEASYLAAVLAAGDGAVLSGRAAAHLWGLVKGPPAAPVVITATERRIEGVRTQRSRQIEPADVTTFNAIPITTVPRTLVELAAELHVDGLARACHEAGVRYGVTPKAVEAVLGRRPSSPGAGNLRRIIKGDVRVTLSTLERRVGEAPKVVAARSGLPLPLSVLLPGVARVVELVAVELHSEPIFGPAAIHASAAETSSRIPD
jgi:hypothetical protein